MPWWRARAYNCFPSQFLEPLLNLYIYFFLFQTRNNIYSSASYSGFQYTRLAYFRVLDIDVTSETAARHAYYVYGAGCPLLAVSLFIDCSPSQRNV